MEATKSKRTNAEQRAYRESRGLPPKKKTKSKAKHTQSDIDVTRSAITDLSKVITYLNKHFHAISFTHQQKHAVQNNDDKYAKIQKLLAEEYDKNTEFG